ncbi:hypothetical protein TrRE_jg1390 [Triparma retinervis]|uniref:Uncharacterized protein n=1 Tax=Triparma retinervis TaxID=2557542 RepID=A0A9W7CG17_9STRA|nr:hypothetical protein TrRE_jg1390 [Triparma retinervis]
MITRKSRWRLTEAGFSFGRLRNSTRGSPPRLQRPRPKQLHYYDECGAHLYSQFSICLLLSAFLGVRLFLAPLASASGLPSLGEIRVFDELPRR